VIVSFIRLLNGDEFYLKLDEEMGLRSDRVKQLQEPSQGHPKPFKNQTFSTKSAENMLEIQRLAS